jgi:hypothetical protein
LIGSPTDLSFVNVLDHGFKTLDGRIQDAFLGTPGGDAGEFILALQIYSELKAVNVHLS